MVVGDDGKDEPASGGGAAISAEGLAAGDMAGFSVDAVAVILLAEAAGLGEGAAGGSGEGIAVHPEVGVLGHIGQDGGDGAGGEAVLVAEAAAIVDFEVVGMDF